MSQHHGFSRRTALKLGAAATALPLVHIRTAGAAGKVTIGFWDHWVPGGNDVMQKQVDAWAEKNKVEAHADFITSTGGKLQITGAAEAQAKTGHDVLAFFNWDVLNIADALEPIDDVMQRLIARTARSTPAATYLAKARDTGSRCRAVPARRPSRPARGSAGSSSTAWTSRRCIRRRRRERAAGCVDLGRLAKYAETRRRTT